MINAWFVAARGYIWRAVGYQVASLTASSLTQATALDTTGSAMVNDGVLLGFTLGI